MSVQRPLVAVFLSSAAEQTRVAELIIRMGYQTLPLPPREEGSPELGEQKMHREDLLAGVDCLIVDSAAARRWGRDVLCRKEQDPAFFPVILCLAPTESPTAWLDAGFDHWLTLPLDATLLASLLRLLLRQRRHTQNQLELSESRYRAVFEATGTATIVVEADGTISMASRECKHVTGYSPEEVIGTNWTRYAAPELLERMMRYHQGRRRGDPTVPQKYETRLFNKAGELRDVVLHVGLVPQTGQSVISLVDVTSERAAVRALQEREAFARELFDNHGAPMLLIEPDTHSIVDANPAAARFYGWSRERLKTMRITDINTAPEADVTKARSGVLEGTQSRFEFRHRRADGSMVDVEVFSTAVQAGQKTLIHAVVHDVTAHKLAQLEKAELERQLAQAEKMEAVGRLAGGIAHDFNNALTAIIGYSDLLLADETRCPSSMRRDVEEIRKAAERAATLTRQLLAYSRHQPVITEVVEVDEIVADMESLLARTLGESIRLTVGRCPDSTRVQVSKHQLQQAIVNLALNARDAMPGGGELVIRTHRVELGAEYCNTRPPLQPGPYVVLVVSDTGTGIKEEVLPHIFEPFFTTKPAGAGTGLGLSTVYGLVNQANGRVEVITRLGEGTTFELYLPYVSPGD